MDKRVLFLVLLISTPVIPRRSSSGGGSGGGSNFNRGSSGARGNTGQNFGGQPGGFQQGGSNFRPQTGPSGNNFNQGGNFQPRPNPQQSPVNRPAPNGGNAGSVRPNTTPAYRPATGGGIRQTTAFGWNTHSPVRPTNTGTGGGIRQTPVNHPVTFGTVRGAQQTTAAIGWNTQKPVYHTSTVKQSPLIGWNTTKPVARPVTILPVGGVRQSTHAPVRNTNFFNGGGVKTTKQPGFGGNNNFGRPTNNFGGPSTFQQTGTGSRASSGSWKTALAAGALGAVGGVVAWEAGKAIIRNAQEPFNHGGRNYYFDNNGQKQLNGQQMCSMPLSELQKIEAPATTTTTTTVAPSATVDPNASTTTVAPTGENVLQTIQYPGGDRPKTVTWGCKAGSEVCCGTDCCPAPVNISNQPPRPSSYGNDRSTVGTIAALIVVFLLLFCCCGCFIIYKCFGYSCDQNKRDEYNQGQGEYPMQQYGQQPNYSQQQQYDHQGGYPPQNQYPNQGYPPQPQYPNQSYPNQPYPAQPYPQHPQY